jgi:hypothetical protein
MDLLGKLAVGRGHSGKAKPLHLIKRWMCQHLGSSFLTDSRFCRGYCRAAVSA